MLEKEQIILNGALDRLSTKEKYPFKEFCIRIKADNRIYRQAPN